MGTEVQRFGFIYRSLVRLLCGAVRMKIAKKVEELIDNLGKPKKFFNPDGNWVDGSFDIKRGSVVWRPYDGVYHLIFGLSGGNYISSNAWARPIEHFPPLGVYYTDGRGLAPGFFNTFCMNAHHRSYRVIEGPILKKVEELLRLTDEESTKKVQHLYPHNLRFS